MTTIVAKGVSMCIRWFSPSRVMAVIATIALVVGMVLHNDVHEVVRARELIIVDSKDTARIILRCSESVLPNWSCVTRIGVLA